MKSRRKQFGGSSDSLRNVRSCRDQCEALLPRLLQDTAAGTLVNNTCTPGLLPWSMPAVLSSSRIQRPRGIPSHTIKLPRNPKPSLVIRPVSANNDHTYLCNVRVVCRGMTERNSAPRQIPRPASPSASPQRRSSFDPAHQRSASNARLASPVPGAALSPRISQQRQFNDVSGNQSGSLTPLAGTSVSRASGPGASALASALSASLTQNPAPQHDRAASNDVPAATLDRRAIRGNYGSIAPGSAQSRSGWNTPAGYEDFDVVRRHLAGPAHGSPTHGPVIGSTRSRATLRGGTMNRDREVSAAPSTDEDEFSSLRMQGGDVTREIYRRTEAEAAREKQRVQRSQSFHVRRPPPEDEDLNYANIKQPGGFRRNHLRRTAQSPHRGSGAGVITPDEDPYRQPSFLTRNFYEFLSLYGHFAGEDVDDDDDDEDEVDSQESASQLPAAIQAIAGYTGENDCMNGETRPLLKRRGTTRRQQRESGPKKGALGTALILLKGFVGTGVLFLPRAFLNGGMLFSFLVLLFVALISYYCFILLTTSRLQLHGSFAQMGEMVHGPWLRFLINASLVLSQIGFASAYIVFTSENLQGFILAVSKCKTYIDIKYMILMQLVVFLPLSLYRNLNNISIVVYIADVFIVLGLIYLYYYGIATIVADGVSDIRLLNRSGWTLFIGTAIFTFEGIGLIIPIQDGMKKPQQLPAVLGVVMVIITIIFVSMGALSYAAYGSKTETVIILNMPQDNKVVNGVQFIYSLAILLSTPMQIFPAITILEKGIFTKSGKYSKNVKWLKNGFRFLVVMGSAMIAWVGANDLDKFVALVGSFACIPLVYIYPAVAGVWWSRMVDVLLCIFGFVLMAYTTVLTIRAWIVAEPDERRGICE
ncbi:hypothetical protein MRB53_037870 [Persea americana]|nr:hypothetical protein MRB53_037870 [Persea americana]